MKRFLPVLVPTLGTQLDVLGRILVLGHVSLQVRLPTELLAALVALQHEVHVLLRVPREAGSTPKPFRTVVALEGEAAVRLLVVVLVHVQLQHVVVTAEELAVHALHVLDSAPLSLRRRSVEAPIVVGVNMAYAGKTK